MSSWIIRWNFNKKELYERIKMLGREMTNVSKLSKFFEIYISLIVYASPILMFLFIIVIILGGVLSIVENIDFGNALYLAFITALTIGYGDLTPHTNLGKIISILLGTVGMIFVGIMVAAAIKSLEKVSI